MIEPILVFGIPSRLRPVRADAARRRAVPPSHPSRGAQRPRCHHRLQGRLHRVQIRTGVRGLLAHLGRTSGSSSRTCSCCLIGFAIPARHFEESRIPDKMPALLARRLEGSACPAHPRFCAVELSGQHRRGTDRRHGGAACVSGQGPYRLSRSHRRRVERRRLGSVVGDTTTTMMWIDGVSPLSVVEAYVAALVAMLIFAAPASMLQQRHSPIRSRPASRSTLRGWRSWRRC